MTRVTTSSLLFSPRTLGPWGDEHSWRFDGTIAQLVEGGTHFYWHVCPGGSEHGLARQISSVPIELPSAEFVVRSVVLLSTLLFGNENEIGLMRELHNFTENDGRIGAAPFWDLSDHDTEWFASSVGQRIKIAATVLDEFSSLTPAVCARVEHLGLRIDRFEQVTVRA